MELIEENESNNIIEENENDELSDIELKTIAFERKMKQWLNMSKDGKPNIKFPSGYLPEVDPQRQDDINMIVLPMSHSQCINTLVKICSLHDDVWKYTMKVVKNSPTHRRLMIRNVSFSSTKSGLLAAFERFGEIEEGSTVTDRATGASRGFAFITFKTVESARKALKAEIYLDGRLLAVKLASDNCLFPEAVSSVNCVSRRKLFVRNLSDKTTSLSLRGEMEKHGDLEECAVIRDSRGISKGYAFVTYTDVEGANLALAEPQRLIDDRVVFIALAFHHQRQKILRNRGLSNRYGRDPMPPSVSDRDLMHIKRYFPSNKFASFFGNQIPASPPSISEVSLLTHPIHELPARPPGDEVITPLRADDPTFLPQYDLSTKTDLTISFNEPDLNLTHYYYPTAGGYPQSPPPPAKSLSNTSTHQAVSTYMDPSVGSSSLSLGSSLGWSGRYPWQRTETQWLYDPIPYSNYGCPPPPTDPNWNL